MRMVVANISSLNGYYEGPGRNVTTLPMGSLVRRLHLEGLLPQLAKSSRR